MYRSIVKGSVNTGPSPFLIHATSGGGFPEAVQVTVTGDPSMKYFPPGERYISGASER